MAADKNAGTPTPIAASKKTESPVAVPLRSIGAGVDGVYAGKMCFGPTAGQATHCFKSHATLANGKLSGQWSQRAGWIMYLVGEVSPSGDVQIHMHNENNGVPKGKIEMTGRLHEGRLEATGAFRNGRTASVEWRKTSDSP